MLQWDMSAPKHWNSFWNITLALLPLALVILPRSPIIMVLLGLLILLLYLSDSPRREKTELERLERIIMRCSRIDRLQMVTGVDLDAVTRIIGDVPIRKLEIPGQIWRRSDFDTCAIIHEFTTFFK